MLKSLGLLLLEIPVSLVIKINLNKHELTKITTNLQQDHLMLLLLLTEDDEINHMMPGQCDSVD